MVGEADSVSSLTASACHIGGPTDVNPGEQTLVYGTLEHQSQLRVNSAQAQISLAFALLRSDCPNIVHTKGGWHFLIYSLVIEVQV